MNRKAFIFLVLLNGVVSLGWAKDEEKSATQTNPLKNIFEAPFKTAGAVTDSVFDLGKIVLTPTRTEENLASVSGTVTVMTKGELDSQGIDTVKDALKKDYSIDVVQSGSFGGPSSIFLRGANAGHSQIMVDGVRVYDPISNNASFDTAYLTLDNIQQIEIVKGPQSSLYGSNAIGGVVNVINKRGEGKPTTKAFLEAGSFSTYREGLEFGGQVDRVNFSMAGSHLSTDGISRAARSMRNVEKDSYENFSFGTRIDYALLESLSLGYIGRYTYADYDNDDYGGVGGDDPNNTGWSQQLLSSVIFNHQLSERFNHKIQLSLTGNHRRDFDENDTAHGTDYTRDWYYGDTRQAEWQGSYQFFDELTLVAGFNHLREIGSSYYYSNFGFGTSESVFPKREASTNGYFAEGQFKWSDRFVSNISYRIEDHSTFSTHQTYKLDGKYITNRFGTKIKAGYGTGFKAPTLYQLYVPASSDAYGTFGGGDPNLKPEESRTYEIGLEQPYGERFDLSVTYFHNQFKNLIDAIYRPNSNGFGGDVDRYKNVGKAWSAGYETQARFKPTDKTKLIVNYTRLDTEDRSTNKALLRRAKDKINFAVEYQLSKRTLLALNTHYVGYRLDSGNIVLKSYVKVDTSVMFKLNESCEIYGNIDNLLNKHYEEIYGYGTPGFLVNVGTRVKF